MLEQLILVATLPQHSALLRSHHFPGAEIHRPLFWCVLKEGSGQSAGDGKELMFKHIHGGLKARGANVERTQTGARHEGASNGRWRRRDGDT